MKEVETKKNAFYFIGLISGILAIVTCFATIVLSIFDSHFAIFTLATALTFLGINRIGFHLSNVKRNMFINISLTFFIFVLAVLVSLTKYNIYFLIKFLIKINLLRFQIIKILLKVYYIQI